MRVKSIDTLGQKFGQLTVKKLLPKVKSEPQRVVCLCDCGKNHETRISSILAGKTTSCGCLRDRRASEYHRQDLKGRRFGRLIALESLKLPNNPEVFWRCVCDCGEITNVRTRALTSKHSPTKSCGCLKRDMDIGNIDKYDLDAARCLYLCTHSKYPNLYKIGLAKPSRVRYREGPSAGSFTLLDYHKSSSKEVVVMEQKLLKATRHDLWIPEEMHDLKGKYELRRGPKIKDLYYEIIEK